MKTFFKKLEYRFIVKTTKIENATFPNKIALPEACVRDTLKGFNILTDILPMLHFCTPWKHQKTEDFLTFSGDTEM